MFSALDLLSKHFRGRRLEEKAGLGQIMSVSGMMIYYFYLAG